MKIKILIINHILKGMLILAIFLKSCTEKNDKVSRNLDNIDWWVTSLPLGKDETSFYQKFYMLNMKRLAVAGMKFVQEYAFMLFLGTRYSRRRINDC